MKLPFSKLHLGLGAMILILAFASLVVLRWQDAPRQGALSFVRSLSGHSEPDERRGSEIATAADDFFEYRFPDGTSLLLDRDTVIRLDATEPENQITLIQGRVIVHEGAAVVKARNLALKATDCVLVHYSWLDVLDVSPLTSAGCSFVEGTPEILSRMTTKFSTVDRAIKGVSDFAPQNSSAKDFFDWSGFMAAQPPAPVGE